MFRWRRGSGKPSIPTSMYLANNLRDYAATYWPNKGIKGKELQNIHSKIVASDKKLAGDASPDDGNNVDTRANGSYNTSPPH